MPDIDVMDTTWVGAGGAAIAAALAQPTQWSRWWPDLELSVTEWRGPLGIRWGVPSAHGGLLAGSMEIYLHPADEGTLAYYFLRLDAKARTLSGRRRQRLVHWYRIRAKQLFWAIGDRVDPGRLARAAAPAQLRRR
jgi:hypothetical protein